jgi:MATE family multidrug resistance protein
MGNTQNGALQKPLLAQQQAIQTQKLTAEKHIPGFDSKGLIDDERLAPVCTVEWIWREMQKQLYIAGPMVCVFLLQCSLLIISGMVVGHLSELELAGVSIATQFAGMTGSSLLIGMAGALETFCGQAFGAKQYHMLGVYLQRAVFVLYLICVPVAIVWWNVSPLLQLLDQDPLISELAGQYARCLIPMLFGVATFQPLVRFLQTQSVVLPLPLLAITIITFHVPLCWLLVYNLGLGFRGAAIACSISNWLTVLFLALFVRFSTTCKKTWTSFSREAVFNDLPAFLRFFFISKNLSISFLH